MTEQKAFIKFFHELTGTLKVMNTRRQIRS